MGPANSDGAPRTPPYSGCHPGQDPPPPTGLSPPAARLSRPLRLGGPAPPGGPMTPRGPQPARFGLRPVRSPLLGASRLSSPPPATKMFQFTGFASRLAPGCPAFSRAGCPIRIPPGQRLCAPRRGFSQLVASFIASESQGILHAPCLTSRALAACVRTLRPPRARPGPAPPPGGRTRGRVLVFLASSTAPPKDPWPQGARPALPKIAPWRISDSNRWPPACKAGALPAELIPRPA